MVGGNNMAKNWKKYSGLMTVKVGEDTFEMRISNNQAPTYIALTKVLGEKKELTAESFNLITKLCVEGLIDANPGEAVADIEEFVKNNAVLLVNTVMKHLYEMTQ
jgi:hypothetical protein